MVKKSLYFDNVNLADYGIYITGEAAYNAPERDVELVSIPGRSGDYIIDHGRFQNIEVKYPAGTFRNTQAAFAQRMSQVRNILKSRVGYCRIEDDYNPDEYRLGMYINGLEVNPVAGGRAGDFELSFNCKPQRYLKSGETKVTLTSGDTITNPTPYEASPLIEVNGYGDLTVNGYEITVTGGAMGSVELADSTAISGDTMQDPLTFDTTVLNSGDAITIKKIAFINDIEFLYETVTGYTQGTTTGTLSINTVNAFPMHKISITIETDQITLAKGTASSKTATVNGTVSFQDGTSASLNITVNFSYDGDGTITVSMSRTTSGWIDSDNTYYNMKIWPVVGNSSQSVLGNPIYIDCEIGEVYKIESGTYVPLNSYINLGTLLPVLEEGANTVTFDNTFTSVKITPRWWQV